MARRRTLHPARPPRRLNPHHPMNREQCQKMCDALNEAGISPTLAEVTKRITGRIASIEVGEVVKVTHNDGQTCTVERETWRGSLVEINNRVVGVPVNCLKFSPTNADVLARGESATSTNPQPK